MQPPPSLIEDCALALRPLPPPTPLTRARELPAAKGAYLLALLLERETALSGRFSGRTLAPGWYFYAGSARGPGGLRARLSRHLRREKTWRWHVDQLSARARALFALPFPDADDDDTVVSECALARRLLSSGRFQAPVPGFGSSDCSSCPSHLLRWRR